MTDRHQPTARQRRKPEFWLMFLFAFARLPLPICNGAPEGAQEAARRDRGES